MHPQSEATKPLFLLPGARPHDPAVEAWFAAGHDGLRELAKHWFDRVRACGRDIDELLHDGQPTACVQGAAFAYVNAFTAHVNLGFFGGAALKDPAGLVEGSGKSMRHVKLRLGQGVDETALETLIDQAYRDMRKRLAARR